MQFSQIPSSILIIAPILVVMWLLILTIIVVRTIGFYRRFTAGISKKDLKSILTKIAADLKIADNEIEQINRQVDYLNNQAKIHLQKVGFLRYNPFRDTGGNQSFCLALLDELNNGIVITSLHSRDQTRIYAKAIKKAKGVGFELSKEEQEVIKQALNQKGKR
jgi:hypothetical protein